MLSIVPMLAWPPGIPLTCHCTACSPDPFTVAVKGCVVPVGTVMTAGVMLTLTPPNVLSPLIGAEVALPQPTATAITLNATATKTIRCQFRVMFLDIVLVITGLQISCDVSTSTELLFLGAALRGAQPWSVICQPLMGIIVCLRHLRRGWQRARILHSGLSLGNLANLIFHPLKQPSPGCGGIELARIFETQQFGGGRGGGLNSRLHSLGRDRVVRD